METTSGLPRGHKEPSELRGSSCHGQIGYKGGKKGQATSLIRVNLSGTHLQSFSEPGKVALKLIIYPQIVDVDSKSVLRAPVACAVYEHLMQSPLVPVWTKHSENVT